MLEQSKKIRKVYIVGGDVNYIKWLTFLGFSPTDTIDTAELVIFTGGEDVDPSLYNEEKASFTHSNLERDLKEVLAFKRARELNLKCLGISRGAQFLCVMSGGKLFQHITNHNSSHDIRFYDEHISKVTSSHHQMMDPYNLDQSLYSILAWSKTDLSDRYYNGVYENLKYMPNFPKDFVEPEIVYFKNINSLAIQCHPERMEGLDLTNIRMLFLNFYNNKFNTLCQKK